MYPLDKNADDQSKHYCKEKSNGDWIAGIEFVEKKVRESLISDFGSLILSENVRICGLKLEACNL